MLLISYLLPSRCNYFLVKNPQDPIKNPPKDGHNYLPSSLTGIAQFKRWSGWAELVKSTWVSHIKEKSRYGVPLLASHPLKKRFSAIGLLLYHPSPPHLSEFLDQSLPAAAGSVLIIIFYDIVYISVCSPGRVLRGAVSLDTARFASFIALSSSTYKLVLTVLKKRFKNLVSKE